MSEPLDEQRRERVRSETDRYIRLAGQWLGRELPSLPVHFDLAGKCAGMFKMRGDHCWIRYNPWIFGRYFDYNLAGTVPHEVAHYVVEATRGRRRVKPHGPEWRAVMARFGADPEVSFRLDLSGLPQRCQRTHPYRCNCRDHRLSTTRHNRVQRGTGAYLCRYCDGRLVFTGPD